MLVVCRAGTPHCLPVVPLLTSIDHSGMLDYDELKAVVEKMNPKLSEKKKKKLLDQLDEDNDGSLTQKEFEKWWMAQSSKARNAMGGDDLEDEPSLKDAMNSLVINPLHVINSLATNMAPSEAQLQKNRLRRKDQRQDGLAKAEAQRQKEAEEHVSASPKGFQRQRSGSP